MSWNPLDGIHSRVLENKISHLPFELRWRYKNIMLRVFLVALLFCTSACAQDRVTQLMKQFTEAPGPPGAEGPVRKLMAENMKPYADKIMYDGLGSVIAQQGTSGPRIMVDAHMDELGGIVRRIRDDGYISVQMLGYWLPQALGDQR
jgi:M42 glutamyl aminopeptidase